jgi:uncharacterized repeat protein (TIGR04076 family)
MLDKKLFFKKKEDVMKEEGVLLEMVKDHLRYDQEEMEAFTSNPRNFEILDKVPDLLNTVFEIEVIEAHGCACRHQAGQKFFIGGDGSIATDGCPEKICIYLLQALTPIVFSAQEFLYEGIDPNRIRFKQVGCFDVGVKCGGLGHVAVAFTSRNR